MHKTILTAALAAASLFPAVQAADVPAADAVASATIKVNLQGTEMPKDVDAVTSASVVPKALRQEVKLNGFTRDGKARRVLFVVGDPRHESVEWDLVNTAAKHFMDKGLEVEVRDLYKIGFNPVLPRESFFHAKDGFGKPPADVAIEQLMVAAADYIIFCYPNWHDSPNAITKGYMERVFSKQFAYRDTEKGLEGLLKGKGIFVIMNAGWVGMGRGTVGDGIPQKEGEKSNPIWDKYMNAYKVVWDDTAGFWGVNNLGQFINDRTPGNQDKQYGEKLQQLRDALKASLDKHFELK